MKHAKKALMALVVLAMLVAHALEIRQIARQDEFLRSFVFPATMYLLQKDAMGRIPTGE